MRKRTGPDYKLSTQQERQIVKMYQAGNSLISIARHFSVNEKTIRYSLRRAGTVLRGRTGHRKNAMNREQLQQLAQEYAQGAGTEVLAEKYGLSAAAIALRLKDTGVQLRPPGFRKGEDHHAWIGGRTVDPNGYVHLRIFPDDAFYSMAPGEPVSVDGAKYILEHRLVMARKLRRPLLDSETVHHKDNDPQNNVPDNLQLRLGRHGKGAAFRCCDCGSSNIEAAELYS